MHYQMIKSSFHDSLKILESDIQLANALAADVPIGKSGIRLQMKYLNFFHILIYKVYDDDDRPNLSRYGRKATIGEFYGVILPSLQRLHSSLVTDPGLNHFDVKVTAKKRFEGFSNIDLEREDECGICLEPCTKMVLPGCCHEMCIKCYRNWNTKSESCPFCRGNIKRVNSQDLWVLTCDGDVVDSETVTKEDLLRFHIYINSLPKDYPDTLFRVYYEYLI